MNEPRQVTDEDIQVWKNERRQNQIKFMIVTTIWFACILVWGFVDTFVTHKGSPWIFVLAILIAAISLYWLWMSK